MKGCWNCKFKKKVPGSAHIACSFNWSENKEERQPECDSSHGRRWFSFPYNFDPVWGDECKIPNKEFSEESKKEFSPMEEIVSIVGNKR